MPYGIELNRLVMLLAAQPKSTCFATLAEALRKRGALDDATAVVSTGVAARPDYLPGHLVMARIHCDRQEWDAALAAIRTALLLDAAHPVALDARDDIGRWKSGEAEARRLDARQPIESMASGPIETAAPAPVESDTAAPVETTVPAQVELAAPAPVEINASAPAEPEAEPPVAPGDHHEDLVYADGEGEEVAEPPVSEPVLTESLARLYHGQGHLTQAFDVLDALVARTPGNADLAARRDALRAELDVARPRPYDAAQSGGLPVRSWLASLATAHAPPPAPVSSLDAFFETPAVAPSTDGDLDAFQAWLRELER